ncbi:Secretory protein opel [Globisporangium polare]
MVKVTLAIGMLLGLIATSAQATKINFLNKCATPVELYHSERFEKLEKLSDIAPGASFGRDFSGTAHMFRHGFDTDATLVEFSMPNDNKAWYDISVIPPMPGHCRSFEDCKTVTNKRGFNVAVTIEPKQNTNAKNCRTLVCAGDDKQLCADAYQFPDDVKTHDCPASTEFDVTFCPDGSGGSNNGGGAYAPTQAPTQAPAQTPAVQNNNKGNNNKNNKGSSSNGNNGNSNSQHGFGSAGVSGQSQGTVNAYGTSAPTPAASSDNVAGEAATLGKVRASYSYRGKQAGNVPGSYDRVTQLSSCKKEKVTVNSPVGPLSEAVSMVFRGPMDIFNIAVFDGSANNGSFARVSAYDRASDRADNLVFLNNKNVDYSGGGQHGPQGYASEDGVAKAASPSKFKGVLKEATNPSQVGAGPGIQTGAEVNIMTGAKCDADGCLGYHGSNDYRGWEGGRKVFVTKVQMPQGSSPNQPALWMLNAQVLHSNQYGCNCRGMGAAGGCGELDIAEVIETNDKRDRVSTHYYFYDGSVVAPGGDNWASRPVDRAVAYVTIIDEHQDGGLIKILELEDFDFTQTELSTALYQQLLSA